MLVGTPLGTPPGAWSFSLLQPTEARIRVAARTGRAKVMTELLVEVPTYVPKLGVGFYGATQGFTRTPREAAAGKTRHSLSGSSCVDTTVNVGVTVSV